jgi:hypothetical protein
MAAVLQRVWQRLARPDRGLSLTGTPPHTYAEGGFVSVEIKGDREDGAAVSSAVLHALARLTDPQTGKRIFGRVMHRRDTGPWAAEWPHPGDVLAQTEPGYTLVAEPGADKIFSEASIYGQAGFDADLQIMQGALVAAGRGNSVGAEGDIIHLSEVASMVASLLELPSQRNIFSQERRNPDGQENLALLGLYPGYSPAIDRL